MDREKLDQAVAEYCQKHRQQTPAPWAYPGDLIFEAPDHLFICGDDPKDVAELRRRNVSFKKVDIELIKKCLVDG